MTPSATAPPATASVRATPTVAVQTAIPDGIYRTRPRTEQDLVALGLTKKQIDFAKNINEVWKKTIVYELRIRGDLFVLIATSDGGVPSVQDNGTFSVRGNRMTMYNLQPSDGYVMSFSVSNRALKLKVLQDPLQEDRSATLLGLSGEGCLRGAAVRGGELTCGARSRGSSQ